MEWLAPRPGSVVVDGTLGLGGHAELILERLEPHGRLVGFDRDVQALAEAEKRLSRYGDRTVIIHDNFRNIPSRLKEMGIEEAQGILLDLGVSSLQLDSARRGFSFKTAGPLDMRMDTREKITAEHIVNTYPQKEIERVLRNLGEERFATRIARRIVEKRSQHRITATQELETIIFHAVPKPYRYGRIHPATRSFQALRLEVNHEIDALKDFLSNALKVLSHHGRLVVISFHSLEDREVKRAFREFKKQRAGKILTPKPVVPSPKEIAENPRSRSAKLRAFEKIEEAVAR